jgi:hypothetical protein
VPSSPGVSAGDARAVAWHPDAQRARPYRTGHRRRHRHRLAIDADRNLRPIQPRTAAQASDVLGSARIAGHQQRLWRLDPRAIYLCSHPHSAVVAVYLITVFIVLPALVIILL